MPGSNYPLSTPVAVTIAAATLLAAMTVSPLAWSQAMQPQSAPQKSIVIQVAPAAQPQPSQPIPAQPPAVVAAPEPSAPSGAPAHDNPGLINEIGKLFKGTTMPSWSLPSLKSWSETTDSLTRLNTVVKGRVACPIAANGAPDCKAASDRLCQSKGFKEGKSLDTDAAQSCSAKSMIPGRPPEPGDCRTENYVTQALCQ